MKVLWITNAPLPEVYDMLNLRAPVTEGWVSSAANALLNYSDDITLAVASFYNGKDLKEMEINRTIYYLLPKKMSNTSSPSDEFIWKEIKERFKPDVIHIHGSEYLHSYSFVKACGPDRVVLSIQGMVSVYERYYYGNIKREDLVKHTTIRDLARFDTIFSQRWNMSKRGKYERLLIGMINHIMGRTSWDQDHAWAINPNLTYYLWNDTLRPSFYKNRWSIQNCEKYSIFLSQGQYAIKGLHQLVKALPIVLRHYPETRVYVAGDNFFSNRGIRINCYGSYINSLIKRHKLTSHIKFTGLLTEEAMCQRFLDSHISVCPSAIENSANSIGEAQILGVPCLASYVGGISDVIEHGKTGFLHRFEEIEMLASNICKLFSDDKLALEISANSMNFAAKRHNSVQNAETLHQIYLKIISKS